MTSGSNHRRKFYRLRYPPPERPAVEIDGECYLLAEISEQGIRFVAGTDRRFEPGEEITSKIYFDDGEVVEVQGTVLRLDANETVVGLSTGVSLRRMVIEQITLRNKSPNYIDENDLGTGI